MSVNPVLAKYGNAGDKANQSMASLRATTRLANLARQEQKVTESKQRASKQPLMPGQLPASGYTGERDYFDSLNRQGEIASLTSELEGKGPVTARYGGTIPASPVAKLQQRATNVGESYDAAAADREAFDFKNAQMNIEDRINNRESSAIAGLNRLANDPDHDVFSGKAAKRADVRGDIVRDQYLQDGSAESQRDINDYNAKDPIRRDEHFERMKRERELMPFNKDIIAANSRLGVANINADGRYDTAAVTAGGKVGAQALETTGRLATAVAMTDDEKARNWAGVQAVQPSLPGQQTGPLQPFPRASLPGFMAKYGLTTEAEAKAMMQQFGYELK